MSPGHPILPFDELLWPKFEAFMFETLASGLRVELPAGKKNAARVYRVVRADPYGSDGHKQKGIDFYCTMDDGSEWVLQAKLTPKFGLAKARAAVKKARRKFPKARRYILLVSGKPNTAAIDHIRKQPNWEIWGGASITAHFLRGIPIQKQLDIFGRTWPGRAAQLASEYYPLRDTVLVTSEEFFSGFLKPERLFHHRSALVGHTDIIDELSGFLRDPSQRVVILVAPGGRGKSRLLRAFADRVGEQHPEFTIRFVDPLAPRDAQAHTLRTAGDTRFVVVQDDAHRSETLRHDLIANLAKTSGKLVLATRPQAVSSLEELINGLGFSSHQFHTPIQVPKLKLRDYEALAWAELDPKKRNHHQFLARMGRDCPLVITVGASLINRDLIPPDKFEEKHFRNEVFARFEGDELNRLSSTHPRPLVREILQTISVLAPWLENDVSLTTVAAFIGCSESDLSAVLSSLEVGQLVIQTGRGRRVLPDLFADHLVYVACYNDDGTLTPYAKKLAGAFATTATPNMLRNLSEADWRALLYHSDKKPASLLDPFWQSLWQHFTKSDFYTRAQLIERWKAQSYYQPVRSLELCELAFHLRKAPKHPEAAWNKGDTSTRINSHQWVLDQIPAVLEPIAIFHEEHRERCLDLLLNLAANWPSDRQLKDQNHPWHVIGNSAAFKSHHPITASQGVLVWIEKNIEDKRFKPALEKPSGILEAILSPVFARQFDASYSEGNTVHFVHPAVNVDQTQPMRDRALKIIEQHIIPHGEIATLNAIPVLNDACQGFYATFGGKFDEPTIRRWEPERLKAIAICDRLIPTATGHIRWRLRTHLRHTYRGSEPGSKIHQALKQTLANLPFTGELRDTALFCSYEWQEMDDEPFGANSKPIEERKDDVNGRWIAAADHCARERIARYRTPAKIIRSLEEFHRGCERVGFSPNPFSPLNAFGRLDLSLAKALVTLLISKQNSPLHYWWIHIISGSVRFPDPWLEATVLKVLKSNSAAATGALCNFLPTGVAGSLSPTLLNALNRWAKAAKGNLANVAVGTLRHARGPNDPFWLAIAPHLSLGKLTPEQLRVLGDSVFTAIRYGNVDAPREFLLRLVAAFTVVPDLKFHREQDFLALMSERVPTAVFDLYLNRVLLATKGKLSLYTALPTDPDELTELPKMPGYPKLVRALFKLIRKTPRKKRWALTRLLQAAVIRVSPLAIPELTVWARFAKTFDELEGLSSLLGFEGSLYLLRNPDLTLALLRRGRQLDPAKFPEWEYRLASTMGPKVHSFTNGMRDAEQDYVSAEVAKLTTAANVPPELQSFYAAVTKHDESWTYGRMPDAVFEED
jgi:hypothetical protein